MCGYKYYKQLRKKALKTLLVPHTTLYLDVQPETCNQRILGRGRDYEKSIPLDCLKELDKSYKKFLDEMRSSQKSLVNERLTLKHTIPEAIISEDEEEGTQIQKPKDVKNSKQRII
ncbi:Deoxyguanosine kinase [Acropora cervicornis]|uniref:Deoxyguanosine kinase n=1 Tax=Acropora cervicornis TaxID=6130 RepID=A0AAD9QHT0_ACRCE|nr:Deoxyguanosine kinase [Acropora cervicornis]